MLDPTLATPPPFNFHFPPSIEKVGSFYVYQGRIKMVRPASKLDLRSCVIRLLSQQWDPDTNRGVVTPIDAVQTSTTGVKILVKRSRPVFGLGQDQCRLKSRVKAPLLVRSSGQGQESWPRSRAPMKSWQILKYRDQKWVWSLHCSTV